MFDRIKVLKIKFPVFLILFTTLLIIIQLKLDQLEADKEEPTKLQGLESKIVIGLF